MANINRNIQLTREGYGELKDELARLVDKKRPAVVERLSHARQQGDLAENSDYHAAKEELEFVDGRISELKHVLDNAQVAKSRNHATVDIGAKVKVAVGGSEHIFHIVGEWEADPKEKKISAESPLGKALAGRKVGDKVEVNAPAGKVEYSILGVE